MLIVIRYLKKSLLGRPTSESQLYSTHSLPELMLGDDTPSYMEMLKLCLNSQLFVDESFLLQTLVSILD